MTTDTVDAVVVGGSLRGLVTAWLLQSLGYRAVLVERSERLGGADSSFVTPGGARFDHGLHVLDAHRSPLATRLFQHVVEGRVHRQVLRRGLVLRGHVVRDLPRSMLDTLVEVNDSDRAQPVTGARRFEFPIGRTMFGTARLRVRVREVPTGS